MPVTTYTKFREHSLTEQPNIPISSREKGSPVAFPGNPIEKKRVAAYQAKRPPITSGGATPPTGQSADKVDLNRLMKAGKAYAVVFGGEYKFVIFYNEKRRGWAVAINREGNWELWGQPLATLSKAFAQVGTGL